MRKEGVGVFSITESDQFAIFRSDQGELPEEERRPAVIAIRRSPGFGFIWTTHLSAMVVQREAIKLLGVLHGVSFSYERPEFAPTATYTTSLQPSLIPLKALSQLIAETTAFLGLPPAQIEGHLAKFINPPVSS